MVIKRKELVELQGMQEKVRVNDDIDRVLLTWFVRAWG
jgi:hypothetical protein